MTFKEYADELKEMLKLKYTNIDFDSDLSVINKLNDLAWIITHRINDPPPSKQNTNVEYEEEQRFRFF